MSGYSNCSQEAVLLGSGRCFLSLLIKKTNIPYSLTVGTLQQEEDKSGQVCPALPWCLLAQMSW